jgi:hypothetical protein
MRGLLFAACTVLFALPAMAQDGAGAPGEADPYRALAEAMKPPEYVEFGLRTLREEIMPQAFARDPRFVQLEAVCPGLSAVTIAAAEPVFRRIYESLSSEHLDAMVGLFREKLTPQEAAQAAAFFVSPLGRRFSKTHAEASATDTASTENSSAREVSRAAFAEESAALAETAVSALSEQDVAAIGEIFTTTAWGRKYLEVEPDLMELTRQLQIAAPRDELGAEAKAAMSAAARTHFQQCRNRAEPER